MSLFLQPHIFDTAIRKYTRAMLFSFLICESPYKKNPAFLFVEGCCYKDELLQNTKLATTARRFWAETILYVYQIKEVPDFNRINTGT